jgi:hypothetical protein
MICSLVWLKASSDGAAMGGMGWATEPPAPIVISKCPPRKAYTEEFVKKGSAEVRELLAKDRASPTATMLNDYRRLRAGCDGIENK